MTIFDIKALESCFKQTNIQESFESLYYSLGFIIAIASCPEDIQPSEWMEELVTTNDSTPDFENEEQVKIFTSNLITWWNQCNYLFDHGGTIMLPEKLGLTPSGKPNKALVEFSLGYLDAFDWVADTWQIFLPEKDLEAQRTLSVLNFMFSRFIDEKAMAKSEPELYQQLPNTEGCFKVLPKLISGVGMLGKDLAFTQEDIAQTTLTNSQFKGVEDNLGQVHNTYKNVGRNDECPCGSGKKFKKCCLH